MKLRINTALHWMFLVKQSLCFTNFHFLSCLLLCTDRVWHLIRLSTLQRSISLFRHGHLRCLPSLPETSYGGHWDLRNVGNQNAEWHDLYVLQPGYAELMFANVHSRTHMWDYEPCNIVQFMDWFLYVRRLCHPCVKHFMTSLSRPRVVWNIVQRELRPTQTGDARISFQECSDHVSVSLASYPVYGKLCMYWWSYASKRLYIVCF